LADNAPEPSGSDSTTTPPPRPRLGTDARRRLAERTGLYAALLAGAFVFALPFLWLVATSLKWDREIFADPTNWFDRLIPRLPYYVDRTPYVADADVGDFERPEGMDETSWQFLKERLEPILWDAAQPILVRNETPDAQRNDLRRHITRDLWVRILQEKPDALWSEPINRIQAELTSSVTEAKVAAGSQLLYRAIRLGSPTVQAMSRIEQAVGDVRWTSSRSDARLVPVTDESRAATEIWTDYRDGPRKQYAAYISTAFTSPTPASEIRAITVPIRGDESYHTFNAEVTLGDTTYRTDEPIVLENYLWQEVTLQVHGSRDEHERDNIELAPVSGTPASGDERRIGVTLTLRPSSYPRAVFRKFLRNYAEAATFIKFWLFVRNTVLVTALNIVAQLFSCSLVAYAFARLSWPGRDYVFMLLLSTMMLPGQVTMIPVFMIMQKLGLYDTIHPLWIPSLFGSAFYIFLLRQFLLGIPRDLEEAAKIDGCGFLGIYWRIMLPLVKPALAAIAIFQFMGAWNDFLGPLIYVSSESKMTLSLGLQLFQSMHATEHGMLMAAAAVMTLPVVVIFFFAQRYFIQGVTLTGMKG
jgi:ABC-type glycerol-3-phosphate transport system permease component